RGWVAFRAFASTSWWGMGPPVWMNFPVETPMELARGNVHVAAGSSNVFHVDQLIVVPVTTARMWLVRPFWPSNAMLMSAWTTSVGALFRYAMPSARPPPRKPFGEPASAGGLSAPATHLAGARSGPDRMERLDDVVRPTLRVVRGREREEPPDARVDGVHQMRLRRMSGRIVERAGDLAADDVRSGDCLNGRGRSLAASGFARSREGWSR